MKLPDDQFGSIAEYGSGFAWLTRAGGEFRLNMSAEPLPIATNGSDVTGAEPGPSGSVMVRTKAGSMFLTSGGMLVAPSQPGVAHQPDGCHGRRTSGWRTAGRCCAVRWLIS